jgi:hypothetical protein
VAALGATEGTTMTSADRLGTSASGACEASVFFFFFSLDLLLPLPQMGGDLALE